MGDEAKYSILIVDDEKANLDVLNHILKSDYTICIAKSGQAAIKRALSDKPDLILLDILMPDMSGYDVLVELKENDITRGIPVIFITGLTGAEDEEKGLFLGAVDYIMKPFNNSIVKARVKTHLQIVKQMRTIERLGMVDSLTDIPNRRHFDVQIMNEWGRAVRERESVGLIMIDADKFKVYNDTYGHPQGDVLLQSVARVLTSTLKRSGDFVARIGGEEFAAILPNTDLNGTLNVAEDMRANVEAMKVPRMNGESPTSITISLGVASMIPTAQDSVSEFISKADSALYIAKRSGRNRVWS